MKPKKSRPFNTAARQPLLLLALLCAACSDGGGGGGGGGDPSSRSPAGASFVSPEIDSGPQLALAEPSSMTIAWRSRASVLGALEYGTTGKPFTILEEESSAVHHIFHLDQLTPGTSYEYRVLHDGVIVSDSHEFFTPPSNPQALIHFAVLGDSGAGSPAQHEVASRLAAVDPDFVLHTGDVAYEKGTERQVRERYFVPYAQLLDHIPFYLSLGNHDVQTKGGRPLLDAVYLPTNDVDGSEKFYSFDRGACHFVALNSNASVASGSPQHEWLRRDLATTTATWKFVYFHHPVYSSSKHGSSRRLQSGLESLFETFGVDVVFSGHDHVYQRTFPIASGRIVDEGSVEGDLVDETVLDEEGAPESSEPRGTVYIVTGGGGRKLYGFSPSPWLAYGESAHHIVVIDVEGDALTLTALSAEGRVLDRWTLQKPS